MLVGNPTMCTGGPNWAFLEPTDSNYEAYVSALLSAYMSEKVVSVVAAPVSVSGNTFCQILFIRF